MKRYILVSLGSALVGALFFGQFISAGGPWLSPPVAQAQPPAVGVNPRPVRPDTTLLAPPSSADRSHETVRYTPEELANIRVYDVANASVVNINTETVQLDRFFMLPIPGQGSGSGSVLDRRGHILTNYHVVEGARQIEVTLANDVSYPADLIGHDEETDIAVLRLDASAAELSKLSPISLGTSDELKVGQRVYALGNPFGLSGTLTTGIISSLDRTPPGSAEQRSLHSLIQTDAAMNPGNSGGPLLDSSARMIGMNIAIATKTGQNAGVGFAIPANRIRRIVRELIEHGRVVRPDHGIFSVQETSRGIRIVQVNEDGPAERAGLRGFRLIEREYRRGGFRFPRPAVDRDYADYILEVNGQPTRTTNEFLDVIEQYKPGDTVTFTILREERRMRVPLTLGAA